MKKINHIYLILAFILLTCSTLATFYFYYSYGYQELSNSQKHTEITKNINTQKDVKKLRELANHFHTSYIGTLAEQADSFSSFGKILASIAVLCALLIFTIYKSEFLTKQINMDR